MTEEIKEESKDVKCCCCISKEYKQFLATIFAAFLGCLVALCIYSNALIPSAPPCPCMSGACPIHEMHKFKGHPEHFKGEKPPIRHEK